MPASAYRDVLANRPLRGLLLGVGVSALGDGMSVVTIAWLAVRLAPSGHLGLFVGVAVAAYSMPAAGGAVVLGRLMRRRSAREMVLIDCALRTGLLGAIAVLSLAHGLTPDIYVLLLAGSSVMASWGTSGEYTLLIALAGAKRHLTANALSGAQSAGATILGPALAGLLLTDLNAGWLLAFDAASYTYLALQALHTPATSPNAGPRWATARQARGIEVLGRHRLWGLIAICWVFFFLYGPVEDALPVYVATIHDHAGLLGAYWSAYGIGALVASLITGAVNVRHIRLAVVLIIAGWGACLTPFAFAPTAATLVCFAIGGLIYGPFIPLTYFIFQTLAPPADLPPILAARSAVTTVAAPLGTAIGGPLIAALGAAGTLAASGTATIALALLTSLVWALRWRDNKGPRTERRSRQRAAPAEPPG
jgi:MFS family permease